MGKLTKHTKSNSIQRFRKKKETKQKKMVKNMGRPNKRINKGEEKKSYKKWVALKKLEYKTAHQRTQY